KKNYFSLFLIGVLNGLLPCGFVYLAIAGATAAGSFTGGIFFMFLFGLGTFPMMMALSVLSNFLGIKFRKVFAKASPFISIALALLLIYRGTDMKTSACNEPANAFKMVYCVTPK
ncbi:MAG: sulfite exporter TauE/SafE family protein, partial [bacterium]